MSFGVESASGWFENFVIMSLPRGEQEVSFLSVQAYVPAE